MALSLLAANNAQTVLAAGISSTATTLTVNTGTGILFPSPATGTSFFKLTIIDAATGTLTEIVHVTARNGDVFTIQRGQEGTVPRAWSANDIAANMMTAGTLSYILGNFQPLDPTLTALAALVGVANKLPYFNGDDTAALTDLTQVGRDIIGKTDIAAVLQYLGISDEITRAASAIIHSGDSVTDLNSAPKNSTSFAYGSAANSPGFNATILTVNSLNDSFDMQIAIGYNPVKVAFRSKNGDTSAWQSWLILGAAASKGVGKTAGNLIQVEGGALYANAETVSNSNLNNDQYGSKFILQGGGSGNDLFGGYGAGIITGYDIPTKINSVVFVRSDGSITSAFRSNGVWTVVYNPSGFRRGAITSIATPGGSGGESRNYDAPGGSFMCGITNLSNDVYITISAIRVAPMQVKLNGNWVTIDG
ncbi:hypothetical protein HYL62_002049 [Salmonella enterica]|nr:hypothetical protein [Salmonella enterica]EAW4326235.1 hypothetical protein [Salmonella enterica]EFR5202311.1 hypothetical protein [Salmonella enterica]EFR5307119.1 hypothetical protein [Salmonella enterica]EFR5601005.1 hypothetical protein [Salmonella enterica]